MFMNKNQFKMKQAKYEKKQEQTTNKTVIKNLGLEKGLKVLFQKMGIQLIIPHPTNYTSNS